MGLGKQSFTSSLIPGKHLDLSDLIPGKTLDGGEGLVLPPWIHSWISRLFPWIQPWKIQLLAGIGKANSLPGLIPGKHSYPSGLIPGNLLDSREGLILSPWIPFLDFPAPNLLGMCLGTGWDGKGFSLNRKWIFHGQGWKFGIFKFLPSSIPFPFFQTFPAPLGSAFFPGSFLPSLPPPLPESLPPEFPPSFLTFPAWNFPSGISFSQGTSFPTQNSRI